jgi:hypothetical protein
MNEYDEEVTDHEECRVHQVYDNRLVHLMDQLQLGIASVYSLTNTIVIQMTHYSEQKCVMISASDTLSAILRTNGSTLGNFSSLTPTNTTSLYLCCNSLKCGIERTHGGHHVALLGYHYHYMKGHYNTNEKGNELTDQNLLIQQKCMTISIINEMTDEQTVQRQLLKRESKKSLLEYCNLVA